ncbi:MAG: PD-(D/E)XK nuclease family protein [Bacteroidota bacterium]
MQLTFGLHLDDQTLPRKDTPTGGSLVGGPRRLLAFLESHLGLTGHPENIDYLRIEQFRQALILRISANEGALFFAKSFAADPFATAAELLSRRDELKLAGWDFNAKADMPPRIGTLAEIEAVFHNQPDREEEPLELTVGFADRFCQILEKIPEQGHPFTSIVLNEPLELLPCHFQRLFRLMENSGSRPTIGQVPAIVTGAGVDQVERSGGQPLDLFSQPPSSDMAESDLEKFKSRIAGKSLKKQTLTADGSLLVLKAKRSNEAAAYLAQVLRLNEHFRPACLIPEKNRTLDIALVKAGLPSLGILSASLARPALQILKLAPTFLWQPIDPFKILEFVSLAIKPLPDELATEIARQVARSPGLHGEGWYAMTKRYFSELEQKEPVKVVEEQRRQYEFWFERQRYTIDRTVPKREVIQVYDYIREWAYQLFEEQNSKGHSLLVLSEQAKRIVELLQALPESELGYLQLERIVRTIYEPSPVTFQEREVGHLAFTMHPSAFIGPVKETVWWDFVQHEPTHFFSRWYPSERQFFQQQNLYLDTPELENSRQLWQRNRPVLMTGERLMLLIPEVVDGVETLSHPLLGDLEAAFDNLEKITINISSGRSDLLGQFLKLPVWEKISHRQLGAPKPFIQVKDTDSMERESESLTSLESLFYFPYQWFFRYKIKLTKSAILSVVKDQALLGNLAHRVFERLFKKEEIFDFDKIALDEWITAETQKLLRREGAVLLMYGREPERIAFINKLKYAAWSLVSHIRDNGWKVVATELDLHGGFPIDLQPETGQHSVPVKGIADLVLERSGELAVVDLKWRGATYRANVLKNEEDLQLVLYSKLLAQDGPWAHTAYFIIENGKLISRNNLAFKNNVPLAPEKDAVEINERILQRMEATWRWRMAQLAKGEIEVRTRQTLQEIEEKYAEEGQGELMMEILEMKGEDAKWDDYRTLINLID